MKLTDEKILGLAGEVMGLTTTGMPCFNGEPKEVIAFARAILKEAGVEESERERNHWKANHDNQVLRARLLIEREDLPIERVRAYERYAELERDAERYRWLVEHGEGIGIYERSFGGDCWKVSDPDATIDEAMKAK